MLLKRDLNFHRGFHYCFARNLETIRLLTIVSKLLWINSNNIILVFPLGISLFYLKIENMKSRLLLPLSIFLFATTIVNAQTFIINMWPNGVPDSKNTSSYKEDTVLTDNGGVRILQVTRPQIQAYLPLKDKANGIAVVICPGGAYYRLAMDIEGWNIAKWFNEMGVAAFVLKYRLPSDAIMDNKSIGPLQDVQEAIRIVRRNAAKWNIAGNKIGIMGFSAGGHLAGTASTMYNEKVYQPTDTTSARPDFSILMYGVLSMQEEITHKGSQKNLLGENAPQSLIDKFSNELNVTNQTPPAFLVHAADDNTVPVQNSILYFMALKRAGVPAELHIYEKGGHGFGLATGRTSTETNWPKAFEEWMKRFGVAVGGGSQK
jgi:acetyl esterase/lipase